MVDMTGAASGPLEPDRFPKLLRQAQDAQIIDLSREGDGAYAVKLHGAGEEARSSGSGAVGGTNCK